MPWILKNLWLIPALPMLAAGLSAPATGSSAPAAGLSAPAAGLSSPAMSAGAERRQMVAHGASRGFGVTESPSPGGAAE